MSKNLTSEIILELKDKKTAQVYLNSLLPEKDELSRHRSQVDLQLIDNKLKISFLATDITALRASVNSYFNWLKIIEVIVEMTK